MSEPQSDRPPRRWPRRLLIAVALVGLAYVGAMFALSRLLDPTRLAAFIQPRIAAAVNRDVSIGAADVRLIPFAVRLGDIRVSDPTGLAESLATVRTIGLDVRLLPLLRREVRVDRITIVDPVVDLRVGADGLSNYGDMSPASEAEPGEQRQISLELRSIEVRGGQVRFARAADSLEVRVADAEARSSVRREADGPWTFDGTSTASVTVARAGRPPLLEGASVSLGFDARTGPELQDVEIREGSLGLEGIAFDLRGTVGDLKEPVRRLDLSATIRDLPIARVVETLPDSLRARLAGGAEGLVSADLTVRGGVGPERKPEVTGSVTLEGGRLTARDGAVLADALAGRITLDGDGVVEPTLSGRVLGGDASVRGRVTFGDGGTVDVGVAAAPDLGHIGSVVALPEGVTLSGSMGADVRVSGPLGGLEGLSFDGTLEGQALRIGHPAVGVPVEVPSGTVRLAGTRASFSELVVVLGADRIVASGEVRDLAAFAVPDRTPYLTGSVQGPHLSLLALRAEPPADTALTYGRVAFAHVGGRNVRGIAPEDAARTMGLERPDSLPLAGTLDVSLDELEDRRGISRDVRARVEFGPRFVRVTDATLRRYGGEVSTGFALTLGETPAEPFTLRFRALGVDAGAFLGEMSPLGRVVRGTFTAELDVTGSLDALLLPNRPSLVGTGRFLVEGGGLNATPVTERLATFLGLEDLRAPDITSWGTSFVLEDGTVRLADAVVAGAPGEPRVGGGIGLDGGLDLMAAFALPVQRLDASALERLGVAGQVADRVLQREDVVQAVLRIGGNVMNPALETDAESPARTLANAVQEEAATEVRERIQEQRRAIEERATGFLRGLVNRRDTIPRDTIRPDTLRSDTIPPDTVPPDTVPRDTVPRDTVPRDTVPAGAQGGRREAAALLRDVALWQGMRYRAVRTRSRSRGTAP